jgi:hypothetical protein
MAAPVPQLANDGKIIEETPSTYVVVRDGFRVSDKEYETIDDPYAVVEKEFWTMVSNKHSYGEPVEIVPYESKKHRIW